MNKLKKLFQAFIFVIVYTPCALHANSDLIYENDSKYTPIVSESQENTTIAQDIDFLKTWLVKKYKKKPTTIIEDERGYQLLTNVAHITGTLVAVGLSCYFLHYSIKAKNKELEKIQETTKHLIESNKLNTKEAHQEKIAAIAADIIAHDNNWIALARHDEATISQVIDKFKHDGVDINSFDEYGETLLTRFMASRVDKKIIDMVISKGADLSKPNSYGQTSLEIALRRNTYSFSSKSKEMASLLLSKGANINRLNKQGYTPLRSCFTELNVNQEKIKFILEHGADVHLKDAESRYTILEEIASRKNADLIKIIPDLIKAGADKETIALHVAADTGNQMMIDALLENGVSPYNLTETGKTAFDFDQSGYLRKKFTQHFPKHAKWVNKLEHEKEPNPHFNADDSTLMTNLKKLFGSNFKEQSQ